jgi:hypothetical protein
MKKAKEKKIDKKHKTPKNLIYGWGTFAIALTIIGLLLNYVTFFCNRLYGDSCCNSWNYYHDFKNI